MSKKRKIINYRKIGEQVHPMNMTRKEYINYLCHEFGFRIATGWNGEEKRHYRPNYEEEKRHNIKTRDEALEFLGITKSKISPDGIEKRKNIERRRKQPDIRKDKVERRSAKQRRQDDIRNHITYYINVFVLLIVLLSWGAYSVYLYIEVLK
jgi:hypothetical protein